MFVQLCKQALRPLCNLLVAALKSNKRSGRIMNVEYSLKITNQFFSKRLSEKICIDFKSSDVC